MEEAQEPPIEAIAQVVEWLISAYTTGEANNRSFYARLVIDLLTRPGGLLPGLDIADYPLRLHRDDPYNVLFRWQNPDGAYQLEGVVIQRHDGRPFLTTDLRKMPWRTLIDYDVSSRLSSAEIVASLGQIIEDFGTPDAKDRWNRAGHDEINEKHTRALDTSSRRRYGDDHYVEVARLYDEAVASGSRAPNRYIADRFGVEKTSTVKTSTVKNWVVECRRLGLLPPTQERKMRGNT